MTALAVLIKPESAVWKWVLWVGVAVFISCAVVFALDYFRPSGRKTFILGIGAGVFLSLLSSIAFFGNYVLDVETDLG